MKVFKPLILTSLVLSLLLAGCSDGGGFSIADENSYIEEPIEDNRPDPINQQQGDGVHGGGDGANSEDNPEQTEIPDEPVHTTEQGEQFQPIDLGTQIVTFDLSFISINDETFAFATCSENPFEDKYNFAYYTIDNVELDNSKEILRETIDEKITYKFYLGSKESKLYTIQFYNKDGKQYGKASLQVSVPAVHRSFFNNIINIIEIKIVSIGLNVIQQFQKIANFFKKIFGGSGLTI